MSTHLASCQETIHRFSIVFALGMLSLPLPAQSTSPAAFQVYSGVTSLTNSFNGVPGEHQPLLGWETSVAFPAYPHLRVKLDYSAFRGSNLGAPQRAFFVTAGGEYEHYLGREKFFGEALFGDGGLNQNWGAKGLPGGTASFTEQFGGGVDTPINQHLALRVEGVYQHANFYLYKSLSYPLAYRVPGLPNNFGRFSTGLVWTPGLKPEPGGVAIGGRNERESVPSELIAEAFASFGHVHIFADSWWSEIRIAGLEYDRNSWGRFLGARMDYTADILPVAILTQSSKTDLWGDPLTSSRENVAGLAISPIGLRMMWRDDKRIKPYYLIKGGLIGFTKKALSENATYENFTLQESIGVQFKLDDRWDFRAGLLFFHFSNAFIVASNPGLDSFTCNAGLAYHLGRRQPAQ